MNEFTVNIIRHIGVIAEKPNGWRKEVNLASWNGATPKLDIRDWSPDHEKMGRGLTFTEDEARELAKILTNLVKGDNII